MSLPLLLGLVTTGALIGGVVLAQTSKAVGAARARATRRTACPFEDDDDAARSIWREVRDVVVESLTLLRLAVAVAPRTWQSPRPRPGHEAVVVLVPDRGLRPASLVGLGRRLERDLGASIHLAPPGAAGAGPAAVERLGDFMAALAATDSSRSLLLIGHGRGGQTAVAAALGSDHASRVVTLATDHRPAAGHGRPRGRDAVLSVYSLHDAHIVPPAGAYLAGAMNVAIRDVGHYEMAVSRRAYQVVRELLEAAAPANVAHEAAS